jgi:hypothetical protein
MSDRLQILVVTGNDHFHHRRRVGATRLREVLEVGDLRGGRRRRLVLERLRERAARLELLRLLGVV